MKKEEVIKKYPFLSEEVLKYLLDKPLDYWHDVSQKHEMQAIFFAFPEERKTTMAIYGDKFYVSTIIKDEHIEGLESFLKFNGLPERVDWKDNELVISSGGDFYNFFEEIMKIHNYQMSRTDFEFPNPENEFWAYREGVQQHDLDLTKAIELFPILDKNLWKYFVKGNSNKYETLLQFNMSDFTPGKDFYIGRDCFGVTKIIWTGGVLCIKKEGMEQVSEILFIEKPVPEFVFYTAERKIIEFLNPVFLEKQFRLLLIDKEREEKEDGNDESVFLPLN